MTARRLGVAGALALALALAGCGSSQAERTPTVSAIPLLPGAQIATQTRVCDSGSRAFCSIVLVVLDHHYRSSDNLAHDESRRLRKAGWSLADGDTSTETAANSPGHKLRLTYSTAADDLREIDLGVIARPRPVTLSLSNSMFDRAAAMSMMLETGAS
ncbi:MAG TPA: hypothetical protein VMJ65_16430 [Solirubrobacteraceae bacterium]|nr:hypothetical protein [Solirubrobacteraceae bacterium]